MRTIVSLMNKLKLFFKKVSERMDKKDLAKFAVKDTIAALIPVVGGVIKDAIEEFEKKEIKEILEGLKKLSEREFNKISMEIGISIEKLEIIRELTLYTFEELRKDHEEIKELVNRLLNMTQFEMDLPRIEHVLRKGEVKKEEFFRKEPLWIDFEKGCIVERKEVDEIIQKLRNDKIHLVLGKPASGKSVILKNIGFKLANKNEKVYFIELKKLSDEEIKQYFGKIPALNAISS